MRISTVTAAASIALSTMLSPLDAHAAAACESDAMPTRASGICKTQLFKAYVACIEKSIPRYDPKGSALKQEAFSPANAVFAVIVECEPIAKAFGKKYGNDLANILQSVANRWVSKQYGTTPLQEPKGDVATFLEYGERVDPADVKPGDAIIAVPKNRSVAVFATPANAEIYNYSCKVDGKTYPLRVDETNNVLQWQGNRYSLTRQPDCGKYGWHAEGNGMSFDVCTATQGYAGWDADKNGIDQVQCYDSRRR